MKTTASQPAFAASLPANFRTHARPLLNGRPSTTMALEVGQRVRVIKSVIMYHYPGKKNTPVEIEGFEGVVARDISMKDGVEMTATAAYFVEFPDHPRFKAHFEENELEVI